MKHEIIEKNIGLMALLMVIAVSIGGLTQIVPLFFQDVTNEPVEGLKPYTAMQLEGRDIYIREGCYNCHSQMVRPFRSETERYGEYSKSGEFIYDHPFQWGSKRTGPDLHRQGGKNPSSWHYKHMLNPRVTSAGSIMPRYPWLIANDLDRSKMVDKVKLMKNTFDVPYTQAQIDSADQWADNQAAFIVKQIYSEAADVKLAYEQRKAAEGANFTPLEKKEIVALIAYLQRLGTDIKTTEIKTASSN